MFLKPNYKGYNHSQAYERPHQKSVFPTWTTVAERAILIGTVVVRQRIVKKCGLIL